MGNSWVKSSGVPHYAHHKSFFFAEKEIPILVKQEPIEPVSEADENKSRYKKKPSLDVPPPAVSVVSVDFFWSILWMREYSKWIINIIAPEQVLYIVVQHIGGFNKCWIVDPLVIPLQECVMSFIDGSVGII